MQNGSYAYISVIYVYVLAVFFGSMFKYIFRAGSVQYLRWCIVHIHIKAYCRKLRMFRICNVHCMHCTSICAHDSMYSKTSMINNFSLNEQDIELTFLTLIFSVVICFKTYNLCKINSCHSRSFLSIGVQFERASV